MNSRLTIEFEKFLADVWLLPPPYWVVDFVSGKALAAGNVPTFTKTPTASAVPLIRAVQMKGKML